MNKTYTVQAGDTLAKISQKFYGSPLQYNVIAKVNGITNPNLIHIGQVLTIPFLGPVNTAANTASPSSPGGVLDITGWSGWIPPMTPSGTPTPKSTLKPTPVLVTPKTNRSTSQTFLSSLLANKKLLIGGAAALVLIAFMSSSKN